MNKFLLTSILSLFISIIFAQGNECSSAVSVCNNQLAENLDDGIGTQECPSGGCGCMIAGEKNTRWYKIEILTSGTLEFTITPYGGTADYDFSVWNQGTGGSCPTSTEMGTPDRCNFASPAQPTGIRGTGNGNSNSASGNLFSNNLPVNTGDIIYILVDNYDGTTVGFALDFFGGTAGSGTGTTATFDCSDVNTCSSCSDPDCQTYRFDSPEDYSFDETAANGGCHAPFAYTSVKTATVCGTFTVPSPYNTVEFPLDRGLEITTTGGASTSTCLNSADITYQVWDICGTPLSPVTAGSGLYSGLNNTSTYKVCKTVTVTGADCWLSRICLPYWLVVENDVICNATPLTVNATPLAGNNNGASSDFNANCTAYNDVWYSFTAPTSGRVQVNVTPNASSDVKISLIGPMAGQEDGLNDCGLTCNEMEDIDYVVEGCNDFGGVGGTERLFAFVIPGETYYVWISGTASRPNATFTVQVTETITSNAEPTPGTAIVGSPDPIPSNDECINAINLNTLCTTTAGTTIGATAVCLDPDPEFVDAITLENNVWYTWTAPANNGNAQVTLEVTGTSCTGGIDGSTGIQFGIFRGTCAALIPVEHGSTSVTFTPTAGTTYYFIIDGNAGAQCNFNIGIKRPTITSQSCSSGAVCAGDPISASFNYTYTGSNPGYRWAYCQSSTWNSPCTIDIDNPATYSIYNPAVGLPDPGCTPATYTFVGYLLADNGATTIASGYPTPQPNSANCFRQTNPCTFNIYPDISNTVTVVADGCTQSVTAVPSCASSINIAGTTPQTVSAGTTGGNFTAVTVSWVAPYNTGAPASCSTLAIQTPINCPTPASDICATAQPLVVDGSSIASNNNVSYSSIEDYSVWCNNYGYGVWFSFIAPQSGSVDINLTNVGVGDGLDAQIWLIAAADSLVSNGNIYIDEDDCATCSEIVTTNSNLFSRTYDCVDDNGANGNETLSADYLTPGNQYYVMVDGWESATSANRRGNFTISVTNAGVDGTPPSNDLCINATDISGIACNEYQSMNVDATSPCDEDPPFPGASTENTVWYVYVPTYTAEYEFSYLNTKGLKCAGHAAPGHNRDAPYAPATYSDLGAPGIQFNIYTGTNCNNLTSVPNAYVSTGTFDGKITVNLTQGQRYYIAVDGFASNECEFLFKVYNREECCSAFLGSTLPTEEIILCAGEEVTLGVTGDNLLSHGFNVKDNPVVAWQFSETEPTVVDPFDVSNDNKDYYVGEIDNSCSGTSTRVIEQYASNLEEEIDLGYFDTPIYKDLEISGFPAGATLQNANDIELCFYVFAENMDNISLRLIAPDNTVVYLVYDDCGTRDGAWSVCINQSAAASITSSCPANTTPPTTLDGYYRPEDNFSALVGVPLNGTWQLVIDDLYADGNGVWYYASSLNLKYTETYPNCTYGENHGDLTIINNDPFKYGPQTFWLTPVTMIDYDASLGELTTDTICYDYGTPVKVTLLERVTTPTFSSVCAAPGDGTNGVSLQVTSPTGGLPGLPGTPTSSTLNFSNTTALSIPDNTASYTNRDITVSGFDASATLTSSSNINICLTFNPEHTFSSDIVAEIIAPNGNTLVLTPGTPSNANDLNGTYCFNISGSVLLLNGTSTGGNLNTGNYNWSGSYSNINGTLLNGLWRLRIRDDAGGDIGTLQSWSLSLTGLVSSASTEYYTVTGTGAASGISFPSPPVGESEISNSFNVVDEESWSVTFSDNNGCFNTIGGTYNAPDLGEIILEPRVCDGTAIAFEVSQPPTKTTKYRISLDFDSYPQDVSWVLENNNGIIVASGGGYGTSLGGAVYTTTDLNPDDAPFTFILYDDYGDGFGSGGGSNTSGSSLTNYIRVEELHADGSSEIKFEENYLFCTPIYCVGPAASVFDDKTVNLGAANPTFLTGVTSNAYLGASCSGAPIASAITLDDAGNGSLNTALVTAGNTYSINYTYTDVYGCAQTLCESINIFPTLSLNSYINCGLTPPLIIANATCLLCNSTYVAEFSYDGGFTWSTNTSATFTDLYVHGRVRNTATDEVGCEVISSKLDNCPPVVLPIELLNISATPINNNYIRIDWTTLSEFNVNRFDLERSTDAVHFEKITEYAPTNTSNLTSYTYNDLNVEKDILYYYRLKSIDNDSTYGYSNIVSAKLNDNTSVSTINIFPNPVKNELNLAIHSPIDANTTISIYNELGQVFTTNHTSIKRGDNIVKLNTNLLASGAYFVKITTENFEETIKFFKVE